MRCEVGAEGNPIQLGRAPHFHVRQSQDHHRLDADLHRHVPRAARLRRKRSACFRGPVPCLRCVHRNPMGAHCLAGGRSEPCRFCLSALQGDDRRAAQDGNGDGGPLARDAAGGERPCRLPAECVGLAARKRVMGATGAGIYRLQR